MTRWIGWICLLLVAAVMLLQPLVAPYDPRETNLEEVSSPPSLQHPMGTDTVGRDMMARVAAGAWRSVTLALIALGISSVLGLVVGGMAGLSGGLVDRVLTSINDLLLAFPRFVLMLNLAAVITIDSVVTVGVLIGVTSWMRTARIVRAEALSLKERGFVEAARAVGAGKGAILRRHIGPRVFGLLVELSWIRFASIILSAASLDYLGIGLPYETPTWGRLILDAQTQMLSAPWMVAPAVVALCLTTIGLVLVGERKYSPAELGWGRRFSD